MFHQIMLSHPHTFACIIESLSELNVSCVEFVVLCSFQLGLFMRLVTLHYVQHISLQ